jgi:parallel beta-helix repeat protein
MPGLNIDAHHRRRPADRERPLHRVLLRGVDGFAVRDGSYTGDEEYAIFPICSRNGVIDGNHVEGTDDAAIYVGNSHDVVVEGNHATDSTVGIEIENSTGLVVRDNTTIGNTSGIVTFVLPGLAIPAAWSCCSAVARDTLKAQQQFGVPDGTILELTAPALPSYDEWLASYEPFVAGEYAWSGLTAELERRPLASIVPRNEYERLEWAVEDGRCCQLVYSSGGLRVSGYIIRPPRLDEPRPTIIHARGGNRELGAIGPRTLLDFLSLPRPATSSSEASTAAAPGPRDATSSAAMTCRTCSASCRSRTGEPRSTREISSSGPYRAAG